MSRLVVIPGGEVPARAVNPDRVLLLEVHNAGGERCVVAHVQDVRSPIPVLFAGPGESDEAALERAAARLAGGGAP